MTSFAQGEKMTNSQFNLVDSILVVKASGGPDINQDLQLPQGKSIAQLLYDQKKQNTEEDQSAQ